MQIIKNKKLDAVLLGADGWDMHAFSRNALFDNSYATVHWFINAGIEGSERFIDNYKARFGDTPDAVAALTYDAMQMLFSALEKAGTDDGILLQKALLEMDSYKGVSGPIDFIDSGNPQKGVIVLKLKNGEASLERIVENGER